MLDVTIILVTSDTFQTLHNGEISVETEESPHLAVLLQLLGLGPGHVSTVITV